MMNGRMRAAAGAALIALGAAASSALAQSYPAKTIRYIIAFPPGGSNDILARIIGARMTELMGQTVIIDNRPGGGANIGVEAIARAPADGYTIGNISATHTINATLYPKLGYDILKDFTPVTRVAEIPVLIAAHPVVPIKGPKDLIALSQKRKLSYGSSGIGTPGHLAAEMLRAYGAKDLQHVPYKGGSPASIDLVAGNIELLFNNMPDLMSFVKAGKMRPIAVTSAKRDPVLPDTVSMIEAGFPGFELGNWVAIVGPAGMPKETIARLNAEIGKILREPMTRDKIAAQGFNIVTSAPEELAAYIRAEHEKWGKLVKLSGAKVE
ncbi:MAG TPA: tripartite tricarboxylate transporter substrate binding protein [Burkholderiales bacterium]|nr:tripartite tricarboxylate transporter substrate binding protein [Burkholderiales bacterium]